MKDSEQDNHDKPPVLVSRRDNRKSSFQLGRTIGEKREKLETANERAAARKKDKNKKTFRIVLTLAGFLIISVILVLLALSFIQKNQSNEAVGIVSQDNNPAPTIEIVDEDSARAGGELTGRMMTYIGQAEQAFRQLGYNPTKVIIPSHGIREVDFYLENYSGAIKLIIDRGVGVSVEDADRMIRYLAGIGVNDFSYIDVRIDGKAYWK